MDLEADPQPYSPPLSPCSHPAPSLLPPLLLPLGVSACRGALHRTGPQWPWVINGLYGAGASFPSTFICSSLSPTPLRPQHYRQPNVPMVTAAGGVKKLLLYNSSTPSKPAVRVHQLINRPGVVYNQLVLVGGDGQLTVMLASEDSVEDGCKHLDSSFDCSTF